MERTEFQLAVRYGLGRAILHLQDSPTSAYNDIILDACLNNDVFDPQMNGDRGWYLHNLISVTGDLFWFRDQLIGVLETQMPNDTGDNSLVADVLHECAIHGDWQARQALFAALERDPTWDRVGEAVVRLDGLDGLLEVGRRIGALDIRPSKELTNLPDDAFYEARHIFGEELVWTRLGGGATNDPSIRRYMELMEPDHSPHFRTPPAPVKPHVTFEEFRDNLERYLERRSRDEHPFGPLIIARWWGVHASDSDARAAAQIVLDLPKDDYPRLDQYVRVFTKRRFPLDHQRLIELVESPNDRIAWWAINALKHIKDPNLREVALWLREVQDRRRGRWTDFLQLNYEPGDHLLIEESIASEADEEVLHNWVLDVCKLYGEHKKHELYESLILLYARDPCGACRESIVRALAGTKNVPTWMVLESRHDACQYLREFIQEIAPDD